MSEGSKRPYAQVLPTAQHIVEKLAPFTERIEIAGSLRRQRPLIGDIEIVALPKRPTDLFGELLPNMDTELDVFLRAKLGAGLIKNGRKYKQFQYGSYKVDLFLPESASHWGSIFTIRTGSHEFNMWVMQRRCREVGIQFSQGLIHRNGTLIETPEETDVFEALQLPFIPPTERDDGKWMQGVAR